VKGEPKSFVLRGSNRALASSIVRRALAPVYRGVRFQPTLYAKTLNPVFDALLHWGGPTPSQPGPVFIHAGRCRPYDDAGYPRGLTGLPVVAEAHLRDGTRLPVQPLLAGREPAQLADLLARADVEHLHLRHAEAGCFIARVERVAE
jgi:hypothetical protein